MSSCLRLGINGFGPCGQAVFFSALSDPSISVVAINDTSFSTEYMAYLMIKEAPLGTFGPGGDDAPDDRSIINVIDESNISIRGHGKISVTHAHDCRVLRWGEHDVDVVIECSAVNTTSERSSLHLQSGATAVVVADQSIDAPVVIPGLTASQACTCSTDSAMLDKKASDYSLPSGVISPIVCAGTEVEAALAPVIHVLLRILDAQDISYTAIHGPRLFNGSGAAYSYTGSATIHVADRNDWRQARYIAHAHEAVAPGSLSYRGATTLTQAVPELRARLRSHTSFQVPLHDSTAVFEVRFLTSRAVSQEEVNTSLCEAAQTKPYRDWIKVRSDRGCYISRDCLNSPQMLYDISASSTTSDGQWHTLVFWSDLSCSYVQRMLSIAKYITSSHTITTLTLSRGTGK